MDSTVVFLYTNITPSFRSDLEMSKVLKDLNTNELTKDINFISDRLVIYIDYPRNDLPITIVEEIIKIICKYITTDYNWVCKTSLFATNGFNKTFKYSYTHSNPKSLIKYERVEYWNPLKILLEEV